MTEKSAIQEVTHSTAVARQRGAPHWMLRSRLATEGIRLPPAHEALLLESDGLSAFGGYFRIFGVEHLCLWNARDTWKFAWPDEVSKFVCFGETGWGDQYAYSVDEDGAHGGTVYFLDALAMQPELLSQSFEDFLTSEFLRNALNPYDEMVVGARKRLGDLAEGEHIQYVPSPLISGEESLERVTKLPATAAMIINGDLARQLRDEKQTSPIKRVSTYEDEKGRTRIRIEW